MKLLIVFGLLSLGCCSASDGQEYKNEERRIAGAGNNEGFIGSTTNGAGPFLVKGKYERDNYGVFGPNWRGVRPGLRQGQYYDGGPQIYDEYDDGRQRVSQYNDNEEDDDSKKNDGSYDAKFIGNIGYCIGHNGNKDRYGNRDRSGNRQNQLNNNFSNYYDEETRERCDYLFGYTGPTANDEPENLMRPCALDDWQCIRKYFAANSECKPAYGPIPDPLYLDINTVFYPAVNVTAVLTNLMVRGLSSAKIREFYVNKRSGNLVFAFDVTDMTETIPRVYLRYRRTAKESIVLADYGTAQFRAVTFTAVIPKVPHLRLDLADIHVDIQDTIVPIFIGPGGYNSTDPDVVSAFAQFNLLNPIIAREGLFFRSQLLTAIFIQENICDFGLKFISV